MYNSQHKFDPLKFLDVAESMSSSDDKEEFCRALINRAYYAAFGHIREIFLPNNTNSSVHKDLIEYLKRMPNYERIGINLEGLFKQRKEADYRYGLVKNKATCSFTIQEARELIKEFDDLQKKEKSFK